MTPRIQNALTRMVAYGGPVTKQRALEYLQAADWYTGGSWLPGTTPAQRKAYLTLFHVLEGLELRPLTFLWFLFRKTEMGMAWARMPARLTGVKVSALLQGWLSSGGEKAAYQFARAALTDYNRILPTSPAYVRCEKMLANNEGPDSYLWAATVNDLFGLPSLRELCTRCVTEAEQKGMKWL